MTRSSTSISAALGMATASRLSGINRHVVAVIGDGAMTAGMAFEALNNAGAMEDVDLLVILNDNEMSISPPVGALNKHLAKLMSGRFYAAAKRAGEKVLGELAKRAEESPEGSDARFLLAAERYFTGDPKAVEGFVALRAALPDDKAVELFDAAAAKRFSAAADELPPVAPAPK